MATAGCSARTDLLATAPPAPSPTPAPQAVRPAAPNAPQLLRRSVAALSGIRGYALRATNTSGGQTVAVDVAYRDASAWRFSLHAGSLSWDAIVLGHTGYFRASLEYWMSHGGASAAKLAGHWLIVTAGTLQSTRTSLGGLFSPDTIARCMAEDHGNLSVVGRETVAGRPAVVIRDAGNVPGSTPSLYAIAASGAPYPLRITPIGAQRPGGRIDVCNDGTGGGVHGAITFDALGNVPPITAPAGAVAPTATSPRAPGSHPRPSRARHPARRG
jgi:hypothetical protein